jgi:hypothetical protein
LASSGTPAIMGPLNPSSAMNTMINSIARVR